VSNSPCGFGRRHLRATSRSAVADKAAALRHRAIALPKREVAEDHAARMRDLCPRNAELINVEEIAAAD